MKSPRVNLASSESNMAGWKVDAVGRLSILNIAWTDPQASHTSH